MERVPFLDAISDDKLLKNSFDELSGPQQVCLKAFYGLPLTHEKPREDSLFTELEYWAIGQGQFEHDELGFVTRIIPCEYIPKEYEQLWGVIGRRAGKTDSLMSFITTYEAVLGGHEEYVRDKQDCFVYLIAHRLGLAKSSLQFVRSHLLKSPLLKNEIIDSPADSIKLKNGITIMPSPPSLKAQRGVAVPVAALDEVGFWYSDPDAANPDMEVERAVRYSQQQFPNRKRVGISTPWTKEGLLWKYHNAGTEGCKLPASYSKTEYQDVLVWFSTTAAFENPGLFRDQDARAQMERIRAADPEAFKRESLCQFLDSVSGFLSAGLVDSACHKAEGKTEMPPAKPEEKVQPTYVAAMDPAFRHDDFAFCIVHKDINGVHLDVLRRWTPIEGQRLNPRAVLAEIVPLCQQYGIQLLYSDQYQLESLQQLAIDQGLVIEGVDFTSRSKAKIYGSLQQLVNQQKLTLLDPSRNEDAAQLRQQLVVLERRHTTTGGVQISAPEGRKDDLCSVLALACSRSIMLDPDIKQEVVNQEPTLFDRCMATIRKRRAVDEF